MLEQKEQPLFALLSWRNSRIIGSILLIASCCLGAGMLALPMTTGIAGFFPSLFIFILIWFYMLITAKLLVEANSWFPNESINLVTLADRLLGPVGRKITWITFLFLFYCLLTAFLVKGGALMHTAIEVYTPRVSAQNIMVFLALGSFLLVAKGIYHIDRINGFFLVAFFLSYFVILALSLDYAHIQNLTHQSWSKTFFLLPFLVTSFGFHNIIPSIKQYLNNNEKQLRFVIHVGGSLPLFVYILWIAVMLAVIPLDGEWGVLAGFANNRLATETVNVLIGSHALEAFVWLFAFTTILTSIFGIGLSMVDFFIDGFQLKSKRKRLLASVLTFIPPLIFSQYQTKIFFLALEWAGGFAAIMLYGFMPAFIVWRGRYHLHYASKNPCIKTKAGLLVVMVVALFIFILELLKNLSIIKVC